MKGCSIHQEEVTHLGRSFGESAIGGLDKQAAAIGRDISEIGVVGTEGKPLTEASSQVVFRQ